MYLSFSLKRDSDSNLDSHSDTPDGWNFPSRSLDLDKSGKFASFKAAMDLMGVSAIAHLPPPIMFIMVPRD